MAVILVVDDEDNIRTYFHTLLEGEHIVLEAEGGDKTFSYLGKVRPNLIILDIMLPGDMSGVEICKQIRTMRGMDEVPVLAISGYAHRDAISKLSSECEIAAFLEKPFAKGEPMHTINRLLSEESTSPKRLATRLANAGHLEIQEAVMMLVSMDSGPGALTYLREALSQLGEVIIDGQ